MARLPSSCIPVQHVMGDENPHVPAMELWGYTTGTANLPDAHFAHLLFCLECQCLVNQFIEVLDEIPPVVPSQAA